MGIGGKIIRQAAPDGLLKRDRCLSLIPNLPFSKLRKIALAILTTQHQVFDFLALEQDSTK
jgi:hypothetical protein